MMYEVITDTDGNDHTIEADSFQPETDWVRFYRNDKCIAAFPTSVVLSVKLLSENEGKDQ